MRTLLLLSFILMASICQAQKDTVKLNIPFDEKGAIVYSFTEDVTATKQILFKNAQTWLANSFNNYKAVVQVDDKDSGHLIAKGIWTDPNTSVDGKYYFTISVDIKDNKYRIKLYNIISHYILFGSVTERPFEDVVIKNLKQKGKSREKAKKYLNDDDEIFRGLLISFKQAMNKKDDF